MVVELRNSRGDSVEVMTFGAILRSWHLQTQAGEAINILLGYPHRQSYQFDRAYHGAIVGRYCNRIANGRFTLNGQAYKLTRNEGEHHLHGGEHGFSRRTWTVEERDCSTLVLGLFSADGEEGYPGNLSVTLRYALDADGALNIDWEAQTDADTVISLSSHGYFNLAGAGDIREHYLRIPADNYTPVDANLLPTGEIRSVAGTPFDLREFTRLGDIVTSDTPEISACDGLDHNFAMGEAGKMRTRAELFYPGNGLLLTASSTLPGLQCYSGNHLQANGVHGSYEGICLEPQHYPDSPNRPNFPSPLLRAGETMRHSIRYHVGRTDDRTGKP